MPADLHQYPSSKFRIMMAMHLHGVSRQPACNLVETVQRKVKWTFDINRKPLNYKARL
jgi:hypothetical protein